MHACMRALVCLCETLRVLEIPVLRQHMCTDLADDIRTSAQEHHRDDPGHLTPAPESFRHRGALFHVYLDGSPSSDVGGAVLETNSVPGQPADLTDAGFTHGYFVWTTLTSITWTALQRVQGFQ